MLRTVILQNEKEKEKETYRVGKGIKKKEGEKGFQVRNDKRRREGKEREKVKLKVFEDGEWRNSKYDFRY